MLYPAGARIDAAGRAASASTQPRSACRRQCETPSGRDNPLPTDLRSRSYLTELQMRNRRKQNPVAILRAEPALITVWFLVRVQAGPPRFALTGYTWRSHTRPLGRSVSGVA